MQSIEQGDFGRTEWGVLQTIAESTKATSAMVAAQSQEIRSLVGKFDNLQEKVIRLEEQRYGRDIERLAEATSRLEKRLVTIELSQASMLGQFRGAGTLAALVKTYFPLLAVAVAAFFYFNGYKIEKLP